MNLKIAEHFFSCQCEGCSVGVPSIFLRVSGCNFQCQFCDTIEVWKQGTFYTIEELVQLFIDKGYFKRINEGAHLILTGGNPLLVQDRLSAFLSAAVGSGKLAYKPFIEVETQADRLPTADFRGWVSQWNASPKLANSGEPEHKRIVPEVLAFLAAQSKVCFKFPVASEADMPEVSAIVKSHHLPRSKVYLMPVCNSRATHAAVAPAVAELAKEHGFCFSPRLHLVLYDQACGV